MQRRLTLIIPLLFGILLVLPFRSNSQNNEKTIFDRIEYIYGLKTVIDKGVWKGFSDKKFDLPLVYYTDSICYVANPTDKFITSRKPKLVHERKPVTIYKTEVIDRIPFHMETNMTFGDSSSAYTHKSPFMNCSSFEITRQTVPDVNATEQWATMVIHEYFHGFQFKHADHMNYFEDSIAMSSDTLKKVYKSEPWFKELVDDENKILLSALAATNDKQVSMLIDSFFVLREKRRLKTKQKLNYNISTVEQSYETMEGTARYVEYSLYTIFTKKRPDKSLSKSDSSYHSYKYFNKYTIENDPWLYLTEKTDYFYATGFNLVRLLDKLRSDYKTHLFKEGGLSLEQLLKQHRTKRNGS